MDAVELVDAVVRLGIGNGPRGMSLRRGAKSRSMNKLFGIGRSVELMG